MPVITALFISSKDGIVMSLPIKTMKAAILVEQKQPLIIDEIELPETLFCGQVLVKINYSGICGSQLGEIDGAKGPDNYLPHLLGHEGSGTVIEIGQGVTRIKPGDHVVLHWMKAPGIESALPLYTWRGKPLNAGWVTSFNQYAIVSENRLTPLSSEVDGRIAALFGCAVTTGLGVVINNARLQPGESLVVLGAGGVGLNVIQGAVLVSANPIVGVDLYDNRLDLACQLGATHRLNSAHITDLRAALLDVVRGRYFDVVVDNTGLPEMIRLAYDITGPQGRVILVGVPKKGNETSLYTLPLHFGKTITGSHGGETQPDKDIPRYLRLYQSGKLRLDTFITHECGLDDINDAIAQLRSGTAAGRCIIRL
jgi:S-(hydroxymethyl)glutathione dehydrogenase/alcohol dehydrogenase